jgi:SAM-dependent methyltransferase
MCCGTGQLSCLLCERGYRVTGIDSSADMIRFARFNAPDANLIVEDARYFRFAPVFDAVISTYDSLNFITEPTGLKGVFANVSACLKEDGWFVFDMNTETGYLDHWAGGTFDIVEEDHACIVKMINDQLEQPSFEITIFRLLDQWHRFDLTLHQRHYGEFEIRELLTATGFSQVQTFGYQDETGLGRLTDESERMYFVCRKAGIFSP